MRPLHFVVLVLVLGTALTLVWFLSGEAPARESAQVTAGAESTVQKAKPEDPSAPESDGLTAQQTPAERAVAEAPVAPAASGAARARPNRSQGVALTGRVHDEQGKPVAGAKVLGSGGGSGDPFMASIPLDAARRGTFWRELSEATTDSEGRFELTGIQPGAAQLAIRKAGFAPHDARGLDVPSGGALDVGVIELLPSVIVEGRVVDHRGAGVANATIERMREAQAGMVVFSGFGGGGVEVAKTRADGSFTIDQLAAGAFRLRVVSEAHPDKVESGNASRPGERVQLTIALEQGFEIAGRVVGVPAEKQAGLRVFASPSRGEDADGFEFAMPFAGGDTREAKANADGTFTVRGLRENKSYSLRARGAESEDEPFAPTLSSRVVARAGDRGVELQYQPETALVFSVIDARTRLPLEKFAVQAGVDWRMPQMSEDGERNVHPGGQVRFEGLRPRKPGDKASLEIQAVGYRTLTMENIALALGQDTNLGVLALEPAPVTRVTVLDDATGLPVAGASVTLSIAPEPEPARGGFATIESRARVAVRAGGGDEEDEIDFGDEERVQARTDAEGVATLTSFEGRRCIVDVSSREHAPYRSDEFVASLGQPDEHTARLMHGGSVRVTLKNADGTPVAGGRVEHRSADDGGGSVFFGPRAGRNVTDSQGVLVFERLAAGVHRFRPQDGSGDGVFGDGNFSIAIAGMEAPDDGGWRDVEVSEGAESEVTLIAAARVALTGRVRENGEALPGATVALAPRESGGGRNGMPRGMPRFMGGGGPSGKTDGAGRYAIEGVKAGEYTLTITHPTRQMPDEYDVVIEDEDASFDADLAVATVEGRVTTPEGKPVSGARITVERFDGAAGPRPQMMRVMAFSTDGGDSMVMGGDGNLTKPVLTDGDGRYTLRGVQSGVELVVRGEIADCSPAKSEPFEVALNQTKPGVDLVLERAGKIAVEVLRADGTPASMVVVTARMEGDDVRDREPKTEFIQESGKATLSGLAPGKWRVSVRPVGLGGPRNSPGAATPDSQLIEVKAQETTDARFDLP